MGSIKSRTTRRVLSLDDHARSLRRRTVKFQPTSATVGRMGERIAERHSTAAARLRDDGERELETAGLR